MMILKNSRVKEIVFKTFTLLWALAIFWFYLGNLVNFHQNRIWGKVLIPTCFTHSSANTKDFHFLQKANDDFSSTGFVENFIAPESSVNDYTAHLPLVTTVEHVVSDERVQTSAYESLKRLRAPPVA